MNYCHLKSEQVCDRIFQKEGRKEKKMLMSSLSLIVAVYSIKRWQSNNSLVWILHLFVLSNPLNWLTQSSIMDIVYVITLSYLFHVEKKYFFYIYMYCIYCNFSIYVSKYIVRWQNLIKKNIYYIFFIYSTGLFIVWLLIRNNVYITFFYH